MIYIFFALLANTQLCVQLDIQFWGEFMLASEICSKLGVGLYSKVGFSTKQFIDVLQILNKYMYQLTYLPSFCLLCMLCRPNTYFNQIAGCLQLTSRTEWPMQQQSIVSNSQNMQHQD